MTPDSIISRAHEVAERLPIGGGSYLCLRCGMVGSMREMFRDSEKRCRPHLERDGSGWLPEC